MEKLTVYYDPRETLLINEEAFDGKLLNSTIEEGKATLEFDQLTTVRPNAFLTKEKGEPMPIGKVILPDSVTEIWADSFFVCRNIESKFMTPEKMFISNGELRVYLDRTFSCDVTIPEGVTEISYGVFENCFLKKVIFPSTLKRIGNRAFDSCKDLTSVKLPKGLLSIGDYCFTRTSLGTATIPDTVTSVGESAFADCEKLKKIKFGKNVETIGKRVLAETPKLASIEGKFATADKRALIVDGCLLAYAGGDKNEEYTVPEDVTRIEDYAFSHSGKLVRITLPSGLESIGEYAFYHTAIEELNIPESVTELAPGAFAASDITKFSGKFASADNLYLSKDGVLIQMASVRGYGKQMITFEVPADIVEIGDRAFFGNDLVENIVWHAGIKRIASKAFQSCRIKFGPELPAGLEEIDDHAFYTIWTTQFRDGVIFPASVKKIGSYFGLPSSIWFEPTVPPEWNVVKYEYRNIGTIYVPAESLEAYKEAYPMFADKITIWEP